MSTTRPYPPGDRGQEPGAGGASEASEDAAAGGAPGDASGVPGMARGSVARERYGRQGRRLSFDGREAVVPLARDFTREALREWGWLPSTTADRRAAAEDVLLVVSELVTNACLHAEGPDEMWIACDGKVLRVEVSDRGAGQPTPRTPHRAGRPGGHGMFIVGRLCLDWGVLRTPGVAGKTVWAELGAPA